MIVLRDTIRQGWPDRKSGISESLYPYFDIRDELTVQDNLVFKGQQLVIPAAMRREMMSLVHAAHIGIEGCPSPTYVLQPFVKKKIKTYRQCSV